MRGGQPRHPASGGVPAGSSPRAWRSTLLERLLDGDDGVFSTCVEVNLLWPAIQCGRVSLLHVRGGQPGSAPPSNGTPGSSPRAWRSTSVSRVSLTFSAVFSTCVEVNRSARLSSASSSGLLHVRGGQPAEESRIDALLWSSPRAWRSTGVRARLVVGAHGLLHVRGGQPTSGSGSPTRPRSSPRAWRSTLVRPPPESQALVFSTCVEVNRIP